MPTTTTATPTALVSLTVADWDAFRESYRIDRVPFFEQLVAHVGSHIKVADLSVVASDWVGGRSGLYLSRLARTVACCVEGVRDATELTRWLADSGATNVEVRMTASLRAGGPGMFPFVARRFDAGVLSVSPLFSPATEQAVREIATLLRPKGQLALIVSSDLAPMNSADVADGPVASFGPAPLSSPDKGALFRRFLSVVTGSGYRNVTSEVYSCRCQAPSGEAYVEMLLTHLTGGRPSGPGEMDSFMRRMRRVVTPVALESWCRIVFADAPDPARQMS